MPPPGVLLDAIAPVAMGQPSNWVEAARRLAVACACAAYRAVETRWGHARPRSVTLDRARERMRAVGCGR